MYSTTKSASDERRARERVACGRGHRRGKQFESLFLAKTFRSIVLTSFNPVQARMLPRTPGAARRYVEVELEGDPQPGWIPRMGPEIHGAVRSPTIRLQPLLDGDATTVQRCVYLMRENDARLAYELVDMPTELRHGRGRILRAVAYVYVRARARFVGIPYSQPVVIKELVKSKIRPNGGDCPFKEIAWLQRFGDNEHVIKPIEALQDRERLYLILPRGYPLDLYIPPFDEPHLPPGFIRTIYLKILKILQYLESCNLCHRDLKPLNLVVLAPTAKVDVETIWKRLVAIDMGFSLGIPADPITGRRRLMQSQGLFGTGLWLCPEVGRDRVYDGVFSDLWAVALILFNLLTNQIYLYKTATPTDILYNFFVEGCFESTTPRRRELLREVDPSDTIHLQNVSRRLLALRPDTLDFLASQLRVQPADRLTLWDVIESPFHDGDDEPL